MLVEKTVDVVRVHRDKMGLISVQYVDGFRCGARSEDCRAGMRERAFNAAGDVRAVLDDHDESFEGRRWNCQ
ncbi:hypothetical protein HFO09_09050 [Rhizobium laguerreae]|uniref:hypothetical protein n=1 Tax=Rhizobium laguerreae TaxID=1076926 RepID=UPI001C91434E|nr:hypothetical protein [Rhizobium laguerreae]MBY3259860.1 hypothetical protein [Rhizobium laguerreae]MBY3282869.1 hypothetical protein [Rhizobium laguerreae]MBY3289223.1 hypothetical protein [Rhizobium laguerreae]